MDESYLQSVITSLGYAKDLLSIKIIKDKATGLPLKYGFLEFNTRDNANNFYQNYNNRIIPNTSKQFKLNWASYGTSKSTSNVKSSPQDIQIYIGDLDPSVTEHKLLDLFKSRYPSAYMSKIITDNATKISKGYGFIKFTNS
jgi:RNA recognition motif-containing protein